MGNTPRCPSCGSANTRNSDNHIAKGGLSMLADFALGYGLGELGLADYVEDNAENLSFSRFVGEEFQCRDCGYVWVPGNINGAVIDVWVNHNVENAGEVGMEIHAKFEVNGMENRQGRIQAFFYHRNGNQLLDTNGNYCCEDGTVTCGEYFLPPYDNTIFNDFPLFIPYEELHLDQSCALLCDVYISDGNNWIAKSSQININYNYFPPQPKIGAQVEKTWLDYDVRSEDGALGLLIHTRFIVNGLQNVTNQCNAYFYFENGEPLKDYNNNYCCEDGTVCIPGEFTPDYQNCRFDDFQLFIPYEELHVNGSGKLLYVVDVFNGNEIIAQSEQQVFSFSYDDSIGAIEEKQSMEETVNESAIMGVVNKDGLTGITDLEQEYLDMVIECMEDGEIGSRERKLLEKIRVKNGISEERAKELEATLSAPQLTDEEKEYLGAFKEACEDGEISDKQRRLLEKLRVMYGISESRAREIEMMTTN